MAELIKKGKLLRAGLVYTISNVILRGISFFTMPLFIRLLTPEEFGRYNVFISFESILFMFSGLTMHVSIKNAYYDQKDNYNSYIQNCVYLDFFNSIFILILSNIVCFFWSKEIDLNFYEVNLLTLAGFCGATTNIYSSKLIMDYKAGDFAFVSFLTIIFGILISLLFIFTFFESDHYLGRVVGAILGQVIATIYVLWRIFKNGFYKIDIKQWKYGIKISLPIIPHGLSQVALSSIDRVMIKYIYNAAQAGIFSFTYTVSLIPQVLFQSVSSIWEPWFFEQMNNKNYIEIRRKSTIFCLVISVVFIMISCIVPEFVLLMATEEYVEAIDISIIVLIGSYFATLYNIPCEVEYFLKKTKHIATSTLVCAIVNCLLNLFLMQFFNYKVAAYVSMLSYLLYFIFHMYMSKYLTNKWLFDVSRFILIIILSVVLMIISLLCIDIRSVRLFILLLFFSLGFLKHKQIFLIIKELKK